MSVPSLKENDTVAVVLRLLSESPLMTTAFSQELGDPDSSLPLKVSQVSALMSRVWVTLAGYSDHIQLDLCHGAERYSSIWPD